MKPFIGITGDMEEDNGKTYLYIDLKYGKPVDDVGGIPLLIHPTSSIRDIVSKINGLLLSGGEDIHPKFYREEVRYPMDLSLDIRTEFELSLLKEAMERRLPVFGICHGMQLINVALGGTLYQDLPAQRNDVMGHRLKGKRHPVTLEEDSQLFRFLGKKGVEVTSTHHQAVKVLGKGLKVSAVAPDGVIEGFEMPGYPLLIGVQWHPEKEPDEDSRKLFEGFLRACV